MDIKTKLKTWNKKTISSLELAKLLGTESDDSLYDLLAKTIEAGLLCPVKSSGTNGNKLHPIYLKYRITFTEDFVEALSDIAMLHPAMIKNGYLQSKPDAYVKYKSQLQSSLNQQHARKDLLEDRKKSIEADESIVNAFSAYEINSEAKMLLEIEKLNEKIAADEKLLTAIQTEREEIKNNIHKAREAEKQLVSDQSIVRRRLADFGRLLVRLGEENELKTELRRAEGSLSELIYQHDAKLSEIAGKENLLRDAGDKLKELNAADQALRRGLTAVSDAVSAEITDGDWVYLLSAYEALLSAQSADLKRLNDDKNRLQGEINDRQREIQKRNCDRADYEGLVYTEELEAAALAELRNAEILESEAEEAYSKIDRIQGKAEASYENAAKALGEFGGEALPANQVGTAFEQRIFEVKRQLAEIDSISREINSALAQLQKIQGKAEIAMEPYTRPAKYSSIELDEDYAHQLKSLTVQMRECRNALSASERRVDDKLQKMAGMFGEGSADISLAVSSMQDLLSNGSLRGDRYYTLCEHINANMHTAELRISQIDTDLKEFHKTKGDLVRQCVIQGRQIYEGLLQLSANSRVKVHGKRRQMLKFDIPDSVDENIANIAIADEIDKGTEEIAAKLAEDAYADIEIRRLASRTVGSKRLLRRYIGADNIVLKAYKIDRNPDNSGYRTWEQTQVNNSGAEKFVIYFAVILALMAYTRDGNHESGGGVNRSVLILDNPFGPISSKHVLEPMFEISKNYSVQMICLSDISKSDIVSCFDLVIRAVVKQFALSSKEQLTHEGNELIEHGFYRSEQMNIF